MKPPLSRYHVARLMEMYYGASLPFSRVARATGLSKSTVRRVIRQAEAGKQHPEVTPRFVPVAWGLG